MSRVKILFVSLLLFQVSVLVFPSASANQKSILDYYLMLPQQYLPIKAMDSAEARHSAIWIKDLENSYLQVRQDREEVYAALSLFKRPDGTDLLAIESRNCVQGGCSSTLTFLTYSNDKWTNVTSEVLPPIDDKTFRDYLDKHLELRQGFKPRILYTLPGGGLPIEVSEVWSRLEVGRLEWSNGKFAFRTMTPDELLVGHKVLASASNSDGDRLRIIGINPQIPARLPVRGHLRVTIAYDLKSTRTCLLWVTAIPPEARRLDTFFSGSLVNRQGAGVLTGFLGFNNEIHLDEIRVRMADENFKEILSLVYKVDASWEGALECPSFRVSCVSDSPKSAIPTNCIVYSTGVRPDQRLSYHWTLSKGSIISGQGGRVITIDTSGEENVTATVEVEGLGAECEKRAYFASTAGTVGRPSK